MVKRLAGQSALELVVLLSVAAVALVGISSYVRFAAAGRLRSAGASISTSLHDAGNTQTVWVSGQTTHDIVRANGYLRSEVVGNANTNRRDSF